MVAWGPLTGLQRVRSLSIEHREFFLNTRKFAFDLIPDFLILSELLNISKAAQQLKMSQPALTRRLKILEDSLGTQLFVRQSRGLALTASGRALRDEVTPAIDRLEQAIERVHDLQKELRGVLVIGCFSEFGNNVLAKTLYRFAQLHSSVTIEIRYLSEQEIIAGVAEGTVHIGMANRIPKNEGVRAYKLTSEEVCLVTSRSNPDLERKSNPKFAGFRSTDRLLNQYLKSQLGWQSGSHPDIHVSVNSHPAMIDAVVTLNLYAALPVHSIEEYLKSSVIRLASRKVMHNNVYLLMSEGSYIDRKTSEAVKFLRGAFKGSGH